jgi:hypothetical protein
MITTSFASTRLSMHPSSIQDAVGDWHRSLPPITIARGCVRFGHRLWLAAMPQQGNPDPLQLYAVPGFYG